MNTTPKLARPIDTLQIPFPKIIEELTALDSTREIPYLKAICNRRGIRTPGPNPSPSQIIPIIEQRLREHQTLRPDPRFQNSDLYIDWTAAQADLQEFLTQLRSLTPSRPSASLDDAPDPKSKICNLHSKIEETSGHFQVSNPEAPKTSAISTKPPAPPKTLGHSQPSPQKISTTQRSAPEMNNDQSSMFNLQSPPKSEPPPKKEPRIKPLLSTFSPETVETIIAFCDETASYKEAAAKIREHLGIKISVSSLSKLYTRHRIAEDDETREEIETSSSPEPDKSKPVLAIAKDQLQLRLLELSARADHDTTQLKELFQIITRLEALALSERRAVVAERRIDLAEKREQRINQPPPPRPSLSPTEITRRVRIALGKSTDDLPAPADSQASQAIQDEEQKQKQQVRGVKQPLGKEITLGDELLEMDHSPNDAQTGGSTASPAKAAILSGPSAEQAPLNHQQESIVSSPIVTQNTR